MSFAVVFNFLKQVQASGVVYTICTLILWLIMNVYCSNFSGVLMLAFQKVGGGGGKAPLAPPVPTSMVIYVMSTYKTFPFCIAVTHTETITPHEYR